MRRFMCLTALIACASVAGCAEYTRTKIDLTASAQAGITRVRQAVNDVAVEREEAVDGLRRRLDEAFDADVAATSRQALDQAWIVTHRKAYAAAIDAFDARRQQQAQWTRDVLDTVDAIAAALGELQRMHALEMNFTLPEVRR